MLRLRAVLQRWFSRRPQFCPEHKAVTMLQEGGQFCPYWKCSHRIVSGATLESLSARLAWWNNGRRSEQATKPSAGDLSGKGIL